MKKNWRHSWLEVDINKILYNVKEIKKYIGSEKEIIGVIKGDAYGHGAVEIARQIIQAGVKILAVATVDEGIELREYQIKVPIIVLGYVGEGQLSDLIDNDLSSAIYLKEMTKKLSLYALKKKKLASVHLKINVGLNRIGILPEKALDFLIFVKSLKGLKIDGIFTQFSSSVQEDKIEANRQFHVFINLANKMKELIPEKMITHSASSNVIIDMPYAHLDAVRPGALMYGLNPNYKKKELIHLHTGTLSIKSEIAQISKINPGQGVGYQLIFRPKQETYIATLPIGSTDGIFPKQKEIENRFSVITKEGKKNVVAVCQDMCMVNLGSTTPNLSIGDTVTLLGKQDKMVITVDEIAEASGVTVRGVLTNLSRRLPIVYFKNRKPYLIRKPFGKYVSLN